MSLSLLSGRRMAIALAIVAIVLAIVVVSLMVQSGVFAAIYPRGGSMIHHTLAAFYLHSSPNPNAFYPRG